MNVLKKRKRTREERLDAWADYLYLKIDKWLFGDKEKRHV